MQLHEHVIPSLCDRIFPARYVAPMLRHARKVPFYKANIPEIKRIDYNKWQRLPVLTKQDLADNYPFGMLAVPRDQLATYHESTGTTGKPTASFFTENDWDDVVSRFLRNAVNISKGEVVMVKTPYSMVTTGLQMHLAARKAGALVVPADNRSSNMPYPKVIRLLRDLQVNVAWCLPSELMFWASTAKLLGLNPATDFPHLRAFIVAGEPLSEEKRSFLEKIWGGKSIYIDFGSTETGSLAGECEHKVLHAWNDRLLFEVYNPKTKTTQLSGRGELVVTTLQREAMPLVRYLLGDEVEISHKICECGSALPTIKILGRSVSKVVTNGVTLYQSDIEAAVYSLCPKLNVCYWRARTTEEGLEVEIEAERPHENQACDELAHEIYRRFGIKASVKTIEPWTIVKKEMLLKEALFKKPKFLFNRHECWNDALMYA